MSDNMADHSTRPDEENPEWTEAHFTEARPALDVVRAVFGSDAASVLRNRGGRPPKPDRKAVTTLRVDADVLERWQNTGKGWQTRINALLREHAPSSVK